MALARESKAEIRRDLIFTLLGLTESLRDAIANGAEVEVWQTLAADRNAAFAALVRACDALSSDEEPLDAGSRSALARLAELDEAILAVGREGMDSIMRERHALSGRRRAVVAHGARERDLPRAVTIKV